MSIEDDIRKMLQSVNESVTPAQATFPGADTPQDPMPAPEGVQVLDPVNPAATIIAQTKKEEFPGNDIPQDPLIPTDTPVENLGGEEAGQVASAAQQQAVPLQAQGDASSVQPVPSEDIDEQQYIAGIQQALAPAPKVAYNESTEQSQAQPEQSPEEKQQAILDQAVQAVQFGNKIEDVAKTTGIDPKVIQDAIDAATPTSSPAATTTSAPVSESNDTYKQDIENFLGEETLSEEFKSKASALFEAAVVARANQEAQRLQEAYAQKVETEVAKLHEQYDEAIQSFATQQSAKLNNFITMLGEQWIERNKVEITSGIQNQLSESFMNGLQQLFKSHYVTIPEGKADLVEEQQKQIAELTNQLKESTDTLNQMKAEHQEALMEATFNKLSDGLTDLDKLRLQNLCEGISYDALYEEKVNAIKRNFVKPSITVGAETLLENEIHCSPKPDEQPTQQVAPNIKQYVEFLSKAKM